MANLARRNVGGAGLGADGSGVQMMVKEDPSPPPTPEVTDGDDAEKLLPPAGGGADRQSLRYVSSTAVKGDLLPPPPPLEGATIASGDLAEKDTGNGTGSTMQPLNIDRRFDEERKCAKIRHWKSSPYAVGLVEVTWRDEVTRNLTGGDREDDDANGPNREMCADACREEMDPTCGCIWVSGVVCSKIGAGRVGNMAVLRQRSVFVDLEEEVPLGTDRGGEEADLCDEADFYDEEAGNRKKRSVKVRRTMLDLVVGPYWPMLFCVTWPLVLGVSGSTAVRAIPHTHPIVQAIWFVLTSGLIFSLFSVSCRDPGIMKRVHEPPVENADRSGMGHPQWRWNDQAQTYRPRGSIYDSDCAVIIEEFDHT